MLSFLFLYGWSNLSGGEQILKFTFSEYSSVCIYLQIFRLLELSHPNIGRKVQGRNNFLKKLEHILVVVLCSAHPPVLEYMQGLLVLTSGTVFGGRKSKQTQIRWAGPIKTQTESFAVAPLKWGGRVEHILVHIWRESGRICHGIGCH